MALFALTATVAIAALAAVPGVGAVRTRTRRRATVVAGDAIRAAALAAVIAIGEHPPEDA